MAGDLSCRRPRPLDSSLFLEVGPADSGQGADFRGGPLRRSGGCVGFILCILAPIRNSDFACSSFFKGVPMSSPGDPGLATSCCSTLDHNPRLCMRGTVKNLFSFLFSRHLSISESTTGCGGFTLRSGFLQEVGSILHKGHISALRLPLRLALDRDILGSPVRSLHEGFEHVISCLQAFIGPAESGGGS